MVKKCRYYTGKIHTIRGKVLEIVQDKKLSYTWNVDEYPDIPETIIAWRIEHLDGGTRSEIMLVHSDLTKTLTMQIEFGLTSFGGMQSTAKRSSPLTPANHTENIIFGISSCASCTFLFCRLFLRSCKLTCT